MKNISKIITFSLFGFLALFVGGTGVFPLSQVQAAGMTPLHMAQMSVADSHTQSKHCMGMSDNGCGENQNNFGSCVFSCASSVSKIAITKKAHDTLSLLAVSVSVTSLTPETNSHDLAPRSLVMRGNDEAILLTVAKKE